MDGICIVITKSSSTLISEPPASGTISVVDKPPSLWWFAKAAHIDQDTWGSGYQ